MCMWLQQTSSNSPRGWVCKSAWSRVWRHVMVVRIAQPNMCWLLASESPGARCDLSSSTAGIRWVARATRSLLGGGGGSAHGPLPVVLQPLAAHCYWLLLPIIIIGVIRGCFHAVPASQRDLCRQQRIKRLDGAFVPCWYENAVVQLRRRCPYIRT